MSHRQDSLPATKGLQLRVVAPATPAEACSEVFVYSIEAVNTLSVPKEIVVITPFLRMTIVACLPLQPPLREEAKRARKMRAVQRKVEVRVDATENI